MSDERVDINGFGCILVIAVSIVLVCLLCGGGCNFKANDQDYKVFISPSGCGYRSVPSK